VSGHHLQQPPAPSNLPTPPAAACWLQTEPLSLSIHPLPPACRVQLLGKRQALQEALQGLQVALCSQAKLQAQQELLQTKLEQLGPGEPPAVLLLQDDRHSTSSSVSNIPQPLPACQPCVPAGAVLLIFALPLPKPGHPLTSVPGLRSRSERGEGRPRWKSLRATSLESSAPSSR
jgi:hypothetical protein